MSLRIKREKHTIRIMMGIYCNAHHGTQKGELCPSCTDLLNYANLRIDKCIFENQKPACQNCPVKCFKPYYKEKIKEVMRYAGPRMLLRHPLLTLLHFADQWKGKRLSKQWLKQKGNKERLINFATAEIKRI